MQYTRRQYDMLSSLLLSQSERLFTLGCGNHKFNFVFDSNLYNQDSLSMTNIDKTKQYIQNWE